jgi:hypothetical protein
MAYHSRRRRFSRPPKRKYSRRSRGRFLEEGNFLVEESSLERFAISIVREPASGFYGSNFIMKKLVWHWSIFYWDNSTGSDSDNFFQPIYQNYPSIFKIIIIKDYRTRSVGDLHSDTTWEPQPRILQDCFELVEAIQQNQSNDSVDYHYWKRKPLCHGIKQQPWKIVYRKTYSFSFNKKRT